MKQFNAGRTFYYLVLILNISVLTFIPCAYGNEKQPSATSKVESKSMGEIEIFRNLSPMELVKDKNKMNVVLKDFDARFTFLGNHVSPKIFSEFSILSSDKGTIPSQIATDISALPENSNRFFGEFETVKYDDDDQEWIMMKKPDGGFIEYAWYGKLKNGLHIVQVRENEGGSFTTLTLYALRSRLSQGLFESSNKQIIPYYRLLLEQILQKNVPKYGTLVLKDNTVTSIRDEKVLWEITFSDHMN